MLKGVSKFFAFIFLAAAISLFTLNVFLTSALGSFDVVEDTFAGKSDELIATGLQQFYAKLSPEQKKSLEDLNNLNANQRQVVLGSQCSDEQYKSQPFCNPGFISGELSIDDVLKIEAKKEFDDSQTKAFDDLKEKLNGYLKYPLFALSIVFSILSLVLYILASGINSGFKSYAGNATWLSFLTAMSYKFMPKFLDKLVSVSGEGAGSNSLDLVREIASNWLVPPMNEAFIISMWFTLLFLLLYLCFWFLKKYSLEVEED